MADSPSYYTRGTIEVWDFVRDQDLNHHLGNAIKYICRAGHKGAKADDLKKAIHYLQNELDFTLRQSKSTGYGGGIPASLLFDDDSEGFAEIFDR